jgi:hypothetical protein
MEAIQQAVPNDQKKWPVEIKSLPLYILTDKKLHRPSYVLTRRVYILNGRFI